MKAGSKFTGAVSAVALSAGIASCGLGAGLLATASVAQAAVINSIDVRGNSRVDAATVRGNITIQPGQNFDNADIDESVRRLFATGLFSDIRIEQAGGTLIVTVSENQIVNQVVFNGNSKIRDRQLETIVQTKSLGPYSEAAVEADIQAIEDAYVAVGRSDATVTTRTVTLDDGRVNLAFEINEGDRTKIAAVNFVGNQAFGDGRLRDVIRTKRSGPLSFLTRRDVYDQDKLRADEELLRRFYYNRGYADFQIVSSFAELDEQSNEYTVTVTVQEGERYTFGNVNVVSSVPDVDTERLMRLVESRSGSVYSAEEVEESIVALSETVATEGFPFAQITPRGDRDFNNRTIDVTYMIDQGTRAYVERIEIRGNTRTRDYVIRREFDLSEGDAFNQALVRRAKERLDRLGYFSAVNISTAPGSQPDRVVIVVDVQDQPTGEFSIGAGYSTGSDGGATVEASVTERNFLGRGQFIRVAAGGGEDSRSYNIQFTEPYFLGYRLAAGFDVFRTEDRRADNYEYEQQGLTLRIAAPITEDLTFGVNYNLVESEYSPNDDNGVALGDLSRAYQEAVEFSPWLRSSIAPRLTYNTLDDRNLPREGIYAQVGAEYAGLGGDAEFVKFTGEVNYFQLLSDSADIVGSLSAGAGHMIGTGDETRVFDQFFIGGETIRGFDTRGIGPRSEALADGSRDSLGGTTYFNVSAEASMPMPIIPRDVGLRVAAFADAGTLYGSELSDDVLADAVGLDRSWRASVGASLIWASPFGPLRLDYAFPIEKEEFDDVQEFRFGASTRF
ncbi:outer membrane protein assembly factor BamA [Pararhizobium haloflavum]|uniref:outer membrane protein assembly factor BamA n=1 Tax=Pararhizobium haloflavum TaxID=2037914 RepID=UPI000C175434|nr:outer membrane protein assembly factor BamA [Pararhizobium haloflavum]